jgi:hypothetical protein
LTWERDVGEKIGLLGFEKRVLRRVEKTLLPAIRIRKFFKEIFFGIS